MKSKPPRINSTLEYISQEESMESLPRALKSLKVQSAHAESTGNCILPNICRTLQYCIISRYLIISDIKSSVYIMQIKMYSILLLLNMSFFSTIFNIYLPLKKVLGSKFLISRRLTYNYLPQGTGSGRTRSCLCAGCAGRSSCA